MKQETDQSLPSLVDSAIKSFTVACVRQALGFRDYGNVEIDVCSNRGQAEALVAPMRRDTTTLDSIRRFIGRAISSKRSALEKALIERAIVHQKRSLFNDSFDDRPRFLSFEDAMQREVIRKVQELAQHDARELVRDVATAAEKKIRASV